MSDELERLLRDRIVARLESDWSHAWAADIAVMLLPQQLGSRLVEGKEDHGWEDRFHCPSLAESILRLRLLPDTWLREQFKRPS